MKNIYLKLLLFACWFYTSTIVADAQCNNASSFGSATAPSACASPVTISTCSFAGEYSTISGVSATTNWTVTSSIAGDVCTVRQGSPAGPIIAFGAMPLSWNSTVAGTYYLHWNLPGCGSQSVCRTTRITRNNNCAPVVCTNGSQFPGTAFAAPTTNTPFTITTCQFQSEYNQMTGVIAGSSFTSTASIAGTFITIHQGTFNGTVVGSGVAPLTWSAAAGGTYFIHYNTNAACGTASTCMTTTITCNSCPPPSFNPCASIPNITGCGIGTNVTYTGGTGAYNPVSSTCGFATPGEERIFTFTAPTTGNYNIAQSTSTGYIDYFYKPVSGGCNNSGWTCIQDLNGTTTSTGVAALTAGVQYYVLADPEFTTGSGAFSLVCPCVPGPGTSQGNPIVVGAAPCAAAPFSNTQTNITTNCFSDNYTGATNQTSPNVWYRFTLASQATVQVSHCASAFDTYVHVWDGVSELAFNDDNGLLCAGTAASLEVNLAAGTYYVISEGFSTNTGAINTQINVKAPTVTPSPASATIATCTATNVSLTGNYTGVAFTWTASVISGTATGFSGGSGSTIAQTLTNTGAVNAVVRYVITPSAAGCNGTPVNVDVTVTPDATPPTITGCPANISFTNAVGTCGNLASWVAPGFTDNCAGGSISQTSGPASGSTFPVGTTIIVYTATDARGNISTCSFNVIITDTQFPAITCPANISVSNTVGICGAAVTYTAPVGTDNCPGSTTTQIAGLASGATFTVGTTTNTFRVTDASGNQTPCSFTVTVTDTQAPTVSAPTTVDLECASDLPAAASTIAAFTSLAGASATDNCTPTGSLTITSSTGPLVGTSCNGTITRTYTIRDAALNTTNVNQVFTVTDNTIPTLTGVAYAGLTSVNGCFSSAAASAPFNAANAIIGYSDNCSAVTATLTGTSVTGTDCNWTVTYTYNVVDVCGNILANRTYSNTGSDQTAPVITCPANITLNAIPLNCGRVVTYSLPTATDNCNSATVAIVNPIYSSGQLFPVGVNTVAYTATDLCGNVSNCSFTVTIVDNQLPIITSCPSNITVTNTVGTCGRIVNWVAPTASDNCPGVTMSSNFTPGSTFPVGTTTVVYTATDVSLNTATCSFTVTVNDTENPVATCPSNITVSNGVGVCSAVVNFTPTATDNCPGVTITSSPASGSTFAVGTTTVNVTATDAASNTNTCSFTVTVNDTQNPVATCPSNITVSNGAGVCSAVVSFTPTATDNCPGVTISSLPASGSTFAVGTTTVNVTATDAASNTNTCSFTVTVNDTQNPVATCPSNITVSNGAGVCSAVVNFTPTAADNCPGVTITSSPASGSTFAVGTTTVNVTATDAASNTNTCSFTVTVNDTELPLITCPGTQTVTLDGTCSATLPDYRGLSTSSDNCAYGVTQSPVSGTGLSGVGTTVVTLTATDASSNTASCTFNVNRVDLIAPTANCQPVTVFLDAFGSASTTAAAVNNVSTDNCSIGGMSLNISTFNCSNVGTPVAVILTVTDASSNSATCSTTVTVLDNIAPVITTCPSTQTLNLDGTCAALIPDYTSLATVTDNCTVTIGQLPVVGTTVTGVGTTNVTLIVSDGTNFTSCNFNVNRVDGIAPSVTCPVAQTINLDGSCAGTLPDYTGASTSDNCGGVVTVTQSPAIGSGLSGVGTTTVTLTATDASLNTTTCSFAVNRVDVTAPTIICPVTQTLALNGTCSASLPDYTGLGTAADNCGVTVTQSPSIGSSVSAVGTTTITLTATDGSSNATSCSFSVNRVDVTGPIPTVGVLPVVNGICSVTPPTPTASDNCSSVIVTYTVSPVNVPFPITNGGTSTVTWSYTDASGNITTQTQTVINATPEADILGNGNPIIHMSSAYSLTNNTDFGSASVCNGTVTKTYVIQNNGIGTLNLTGSPLVKITGLNPGDFTVITMPSATVAQGGSTTFSIRFNPSASGNRYARVTVQNDDCNEGGYYYQIRGNGTGLDNVAPVPNVAVLPTITGSCSAIVSTVPTATDACTGLITGTTTSPLTYNAQGTYTVVWSYNDGNGNISTQTQTVVVQDLTVPTAICQSATLELGVGGTINLTGSMINNGSFDNCGPLSYVGIQGAVKVTNGTFNTNLTGWTAANGAMYNSALGNPGGCAWLNGTGSPATDPYVKQTFSDLIVGATYIVRGNFKGTTLGSAGQQALAVDLDGTEIATRPLGSPITAFQPINVTFIATSTSHTVGFRGEIGGTDVDVVLDNVSIDGTAKSYNCYTRGVNPVTLIVADAYGNISTCNTTVTINSNVNPCPFNLPIDPSGAVGQVDNNEGNNEEGSSTTSIETTDNFGGRIYPNPSNGVFNLELSTMPRGKTEMKVLDALGQVLYVTQLTTQNSYFDFSYLRSATYYIQVISEEGSFTKTIIITQKY